MLIAFGAPLGKTGPFELLIMGMVGAVGYTLNEAIVYEALHTLDAGGSTAIHTFGAFFGLAFTVIIGCKVWPSKPFQESWANSTFAIIGTFFLWMFWPSFNAGYFPTNNFQRSLIISNTIVSLTGSCLTSFAASILCRGRFNINDILNGSLAGGVAIGAASGVTANLGISLLVGSIAGVLTTVTATFLPDKLRNCKIHDTIGILYLHGLPGIMGGFVSAMIIASYQSGIP